MKECVQCTKRVDDPDGCWHPGEFCLYGTLFVCSRTCAEEFAKTSKYGVLREEDIDEPARRMECGKNITTPGFAPMTCNRPVGHKGFCQRWNEKVPSRTCPRCGTQNSLLWKDECLFCATEDK